jgi:hypothetical protein
MRRTPPANDDAAARIYGMISRRRISASEAPLSVCHVAQVVFTSSCMQRALTRGAARSLMLSINHGFSASTYGSRFHIAASGRCDRRRLSRALYTDARRAQKFHPGASTCRFYRDTTVQPPQQPGRLLIIKSTSFTLICPELYIQLIPIKCVRK